MYFEYSDNKKCAYPKVQTHKTRKYSTAPYASTNSQVQRDRSCKCNISATSVAPLHPNSLYAYDIRLSTILT